MRRSPRKAPSPSAGSLVLGTAILLSMLAAPRASFATVIVPMTIEEMAKEAEHVVRGRVVSSASAWDADHSKIYTTTEITVLDPIHTKATMPQKIVVRTLGGEVGTIGMKVAGTERFHPNEEVVLFLRRDPIAQSAFQVIGMSQGKYHVEAEAKTGRAMAVPSVEGLAFVRPDDTGTLRIDPNMPLPNAMPLADLKRRILAAVADQTPNSSRLERPSLQAPSSGPQAPAPATTTPVPAPAATPDHR